MITKAMRVFVLGAGASLHAGYPLAADMGNRLEAWINILPPEHRYRDLVRRIRDVYGSLDNFEVILADLMTCPHGSQAETLGSARPELLSHLKEAIRDQFDAIRSAPAPLYDGLARVLRPGDTIITFNYDLAAERALSEAGLFDVKTGYGFPVADGQTASPVELLKLHGSTNWRALLFSGRTGPFVGDGGSLGPRPVLFSRPDLEYIGCPDSVDPICKGLETAASLPAMIMPALPKQFHFATTYGEEWKGVWDTLWRRAEESIGRADEVVVIGYSLPAADERARDILLGSPNKTVRLSICCGNATPALEQEFRDHGFSGIQRVATTFESFLASEAANAGSGPRTPNRNRDTIRSRLYALIGKQGILHVRTVGEVQFTFLSVEPPPELLAGEENDDQDIETAINRSWFLVRLDEGPLTYSSNTITIPGRDVFMILQRY